MNPENEFLLMLRNPFQPCFSGIRTFGEPKNLYKSDGNIKSGQNILQINFHQKWRV